MRVRIGGPRLRVAGLGRGHRRERVSFGSLETFQQGLHEILHGDALINEVSHAYLFGGGQHHVGVLVFDEPQVVVRNDRAERQKAIGLLDQLTHIQNGSGVRIRPDELIALFI